MEPTSTPNPGPVKAWLLATRPRTLVAGAVPVAVGSALAWRAGAFAALPAAAALLGALLIQIGTNLTNDYFDFVRGADTGDRVGPKRASQQGWLAPKTVLRGALACFGLALLVGCYLVAVAGWPILVVGLVSLGAGYAYTGGPFPLAYNGLGDVFVLAFFGVVAVCGTYFVQAHALSWTVALASLPVGCLGVALLAVNNTRDAQTDARAGKRTLVVRLGPKFGRAEWFAMVACAFGVPAVLAGLGWTSAWVLLSALALPLAISPGRLVASAEGAALNAALAGTAKLQLIFGALFAAGLTR